MRIKSLVVLSAYQGKGVGSHLIEKMKTIAKEKNIKKIELIAHQEAKAMEFYKKQEFSASGMVHLVAEVQ